MACSRGEAAPNAHTKSRLFADSGGYCQNPGCNQPLFLDAGSKNIHIGEMAHVFAAANDGPRANAALSQAERGQFENLILLCPKCHTIIDKAPEAYPDATVLAWKQRHGERIAELFGVITYSDRGRARDAINPLLAENRLVFEKYGPDNEYRYDPESELARAWRSKMLATVLPNNRRIARILDANRAHMNVEEKATFVRFYQHIGDQEARHFVEEPVADAERFPDGMNRMLKD